ncbi:hypothetical protein HYV81_02380 [Candidatus Woesearchaeota archaeon]|nr:hypothetical protein [Candidatus Woesearchaeota archaeon]
MGKTQMKIFLVMLAIFALISLVKAETVSYSIALDFDSGKFTLKNIELVPAEPMSKTDGKLYTARITSFNGEVLYETTFNVEVAIFRAPGGAAASQPSSTVVDLVLPYYPNAKSVLILKGREIMFEVDVSSFSVCNENKVCEGIESIDTCPSDCTCGNRVCDKGENYIACSSDCRSGQADGVCDKAADGLCDPDCSGGNDYDCSGGINVKKLVVYVLVLIILALLSYYGYKTMKRSSK